MLLPLFPHANEGQQYYEGSGRQYRNAQNPETPRDAQKCPSFNECRQSAKCTVRAPALEARRHRPSSAHEGKSPLHNKLWNLLTTRQVTLFFNSNASTKNKIARNLAGPYSLLQANLSLWQFRQRKFPSYTDRESYTKRNKKNDLTRGRRIPLGRQQRKNRNCPRFSAQPLFTVWRRSLSRKQGRRAAIIARVNTARPCAR